MKHIMELNNSNITCSLGPVFEKMHKQKNIFSNQDIFKIIEVLSEVGKLWKKNGFYYNCAQEYLKEHSHFPEEFDLLSLEIIPELFLRENILNRLKGEFKNIECLNGFSNVENYKGKLYYAPLGIVLHVTAGNVFLGCIDSILMGILTRNISLVKLSSKNNKLPELFLKSIHEADKETILVPYIKLFTWPGGSQEIESYFKNNVDAILAWGGEEMVSSYSFELPKKVKLLQHGPKISIQVISKQYYDTGKVNFPNLIKDIYMWNQSACANSQNIYLEQGINVNEFNEKLNLAFKNNKIKRGEISTDEFVELLKDEHEGLFQEFLSGNKMIRGEDYQIQYDHSFLSPTALNRSIKIKQFQNVEDLALKLSSFSFYLQTCGIGVCINERAPYLKSLSNAGINRFTNIGRMLDSMDGSPHDGQMALVELTKICADESTLTFDEFIESTDIPFYENENKKSFKGLPLIDGAILAKHSLVKDKAFLSPRAHSGYVYSSGGTTGSPKYCFYSYDEFEKVSQLLGKSYTDLGLRPGQHVANLFMAGNMWSSFNAIQDSLKFCDVIQYPMGGLIEPSEFQKYVNEFNIKVIFGLPSLLISLANKVKNLKVDKIFYAGEAFTDEGAKFIKEAWGNPVLHSAGYASVDVGPIGYEASDCDKGEHYLFSDLIKLEIINEEAVVTSKVRTMMPVIRYRTGDRVKIISEKGGRTKFKLLGRIDSKINIWSTRFDLGEIKKLLKKLSYVDEIQIRLEKIKTKDTYFEKLIIVFHGNILFSKEEFIQAFHGELKDVFDTVSTEFLSNKIELEVDHFSTISRTGKTKDIIDLR